MPPHLLEANAERPVVDGQSSAAHGLQSGNQQPSRVNTPPVAALLSLPTLPPACNLPPWGGRERSDRVGRSCSNIRSVNIEKTI